MRKTFFTQIKNIFSSLKIPNKTSKSVNSFKLFYFENIAKKLGEILYKKCIIPIINVYFTQRLSYLIVWQNENTLTYNTRYNTY